MEENRDYVEQIKDDGSRHRLLLILIKKKEYISYPKYLSSACDRGEHVVLFIQGNWVID